MQAVKGYLTDGQFTPLNGDVLPSRAKVIIIIEEIVQKANELISFAVEENELKARRAWLKRLRESVEDAMEEPLLDFPARSKAMRPPVFFGD